MVYGARRFPLPAEGDEEPVHLEPGENLVELQIVGAALSPPALELLGEQEPSTFCTYTFYRFEMHCTPVVTGQEPKYGFTSRYIVHVDEDFLEFVHRSSVSVELHQKLLGRNWRTVAAARLPLQQLLERDGTVEGTVPLLGKQNNHQLVTAVNQSLTLSCFLETSETCVCVCVLVIVCLCLRVLRCV